MTERKSGLDCVVRHVSNRTEETRVHRGPNQSLPQEGLYSLALEDQHGLSHSDGLYRGQQHRGGECRVRAWP